MPNASRRPFTRAEGQLQMIEKAPGFEIGAVISASGSLFNHLLLQFFLPFVPFMSFLFRLFRNRPSAGVESSAPTVSHDPGYPTTLSLDMQRSSRSSGSKYAPCNRFRRLEVQ